MRKLKLMQSMSRDEQKRAVEAALLLGFQSESALFPIAGLDGEITSTGQFGTVHGAMGSGKTKRDHSRNI